MQVDLTHPSLPTVISAIGALGTAAFGLVEALKPIFPINKIGFYRIRRTVVRLTPHDELAAGAAQTPTNALPESDILQSLESNWVNGTDLGSQKAIAKSLIKLRLNPDNAEKTARATNVDPAQLTAVARCIVSGTLNTQPQAAAQLKAGPAQGAAQQPQLPLLTQQQADTWSRFDLIVTAMLDECYQRADQIYRNWTRVLAGAVAIVLALAGAWIVSNYSLNWKHFGIALLVGVLATPLAPVAKDLSTALATAVNTMQLVKKP